MLTFGVVAQYLLMTNALESKANSKVKGNYYGKAASQCKIWTLRILYIGVSFAYPLLAND